MRPAARRRNGGRHGSAPPLGFTLIEVVVSLAVFAVVAALAWGGLDRLLRAREVIDSQTASMAALQQAMGRYERDVRQAALRPVRDAAGEPLPALRGSADGLELTRLVGEGGWVREAPALERVAWRCEDGRLQRLRWPVLDRSGGTQPVIEDLLEGVFDCRWRFLDAQGEQAVWPLPGGTPETAGLPRGVEWRFRLEGSGELRRVLELAWVAGELP